MKLTRSALLVLIVFFAGLLTHSSYVMATDPPNRVCNCEEGDSDCDESDEMTEGSEVEGEDCEDSSCDDDGDESEPECEQGNDGKDGIAETQANPVTYRTGALKSGRRGTGSYHSNLKAANPSETLAATEGTGSSCNCAFADLSRDGGGNLTDSWIHHNNRKLKMEVSAGVLVQDVNKKFFIDYNDSTDSQIRMMKAGSRRVYVYDNDSGTNSGLHGVKKKIEFRGTSNKKVEYDYMNRFNGRVKATKKTYTNSGTDYTYTTHNKHVRTGVNAGKVRTTYVTDPHATSSTDNVIKATKRTFYDSQSNTALGNEGDLILEEYWEAATNRSLTITSGDPAPVSGEYSAYRVRHFRYYRNGDSGGSRGQQKFLFEHDAILRMIDDSVITSVADLLTKTDAQVEDYASRSWTYYTSNFDTGTAQDTGWATNENLQTQYGGTNIDETGMVKTETIFDKCGSCSSGAGSGGIERRYYYMDINGGPDASGSPSADTKRILIEDIKDGDGNLVRREVTGINYQGYRLRSLVIDDADPGLSTVACWPESWTRSTSNDLTLNRILEHRYPSAHDSVDTYAEIKKFLDPTGNSGNNDGDTLNNTAGLIEILDFDLTNYSGANGYYYVYSGVQQGENGSTHWQWYKKYQKYDGTNNDQVFEKTLLTEYYEVTSSPTTKPNPSTVASSDKQTISRTFHTSDEAAIKVKTTTYPAVPTSQNGSGVASVVTEYFDTEGKRRWLKDADGVITYFAPDPETGKVGYKMVDVDTTSLPSELRNGDGAGSGGIDIYWIGWGSSSAPTGFTSTGSNHEQIVSKTAYDTLGRLDEMREPARYGTSGAKTYYRFLENQKLVFPYWVEDSGASNYQKPMLPIRVRETDDAGRVTSRYTVDPARCETETTGSYTYAYKLSGSTARSDYVTLSVNNYNDDGLLESVDRYHDIPASGDEMSTHFYRSVYQYDALGRKTYTIQVVSGTSTSSAVEQVTQTVYDDRGRVTELKRGVSGSSHNMTTTDPYDTYPTMAKVSELEYDGGGAGDGRITSRKAFFGTGGADYNETVLHYNWRNQLRGIEPKIAPFTVHDYDNQGQLVATAQYKSLPTFPTDTSDFADDDADKANRTALATTEYDILRRVYQSAVHAIDESDGSRNGRIETDRYYAPDGALVATATEGKGASEVAYDDAGRRYQTRRVTGLVTDGTYGKYDSVGAFRYRAPAPNVAIGSASGGDDQVISLGHMVYDDVGNVTESIVMETHHDDGTAGLDLTSDDDYVQTAVYSWYDLAHRPRDVAKYGTDATGWTYDALVARPSTAPSSSDTVLVASYAYDDVTSRPLTVTKPQSSGVDTTTKWFYDNLSRKTYVAENYANFDPDTANTTGDVTDHSKDRVMQYKYDGLSNVTKLVALDSNGDGSTTTGDDQKTLYLYEDSHRAGLVTNVIYPDSSDTDSSGTDQYKREYNLDGTLKKRADPVKSGETATVVEFDYDDLRRMTKSRVTTVGTGVDSTVQSIVRTYDTAGRMEKVGTYASNDGTGTPLNEVFNEYDDFDRIAKQYQEHSGAKVSGSENVAYGFDTSKTSDVYDHASRATKLTYPNGEIIHYDYGASGSISDKLSRTEALQMDDPTTSGTPEEDIVRYAFNGMGTLATKTIHHLERYNDESHDFVLDYFGSTTGTYDGYDRFGRITDQHWTYEYDDGTNPVSTSDVFHIKHGYDRASNRLYAERQLDVYKSYSQVFDHDGLNRLDDFRVGEITSTQDDVESYWPGRAQEWTLDQMGNAKALKDHGQTDWQTDVFNAANEFGDSQGDRVIAHDAGPNFRASQDFATDTSSNYVKTGATMAGSGGVATPTPTGSDPAIALLGEAIGPNSPRVELELTNGSIANGEYAGFVFGYQSSSDYWMIVAEVVSGNVEYRLYYYDGTSKTQHGNSLDQGALSTSTTYNLYGLLDYQSAQRFGYAFTDGFPSGKVGLISTDSSIEFERFDVADNALVAQTTGRWINTNPNAVIVNNSGTSADGQLKLPGDWTGYYQPILLKGLYGDNVEMIFRVYKTTTSDRSFGVVLNARNGDDYNAVTCHLTTAGQDPDGNVIRKGALRAAVTDSAAGTFPGAGANDVVWIRVARDGADLTVKALNQDTKPSDATWNSTTACYIGSYGGGSRFNDVTGLVGFLADSEVYVDDLTVRLDTDSDDDYTDEVDAVIEAFDLDTASSSDGEHLEHDAKGNLTYDGVFKYTYDAWNRMVKVERAWRDSSGTIHANLIVQKNTYDGLGRRIVKEIDNSGNKDYSFHYYYDGFRIIETQNGSEQVIKHQVLGLLYVDELVRVSVTKSESNGADPANAWARHYYALHDAQYNVIGLVEGDYGRLVERYEYTPYGQRLVFSHGTGLLADVNRDGDVGPADNAAYKLKWGNDTGVNDYEDMNGDGTVGPADRAIINQTFGDRDDSYTNDPGVMYPRLASLGGLAEGYPNADASAFPLNEFGHQGLMHDETTGLIYNRARFRNSERFLQRDPLGYPDGLNTYASHHVMRGQGDSYGMCLEMVRPGIGSGHGGNVPYPNGGDPEFAVGFWLVGASFVPIVGEGMDVAVLLGPGSSRAERKWALGSLWINAATFGFMPNAGAISKVDDIVGSPSSSTRAATSASSGSTPSAKCSTTGSGPGGSSFAPISGATPPSARPSSGYDAPIGPNLPVGGAVADTIPAGQRIQPFYPPNQGFLGNPVTETLQPGVRIDRFGFEGGTFTSPVGTPGPMRALPPGAAEKPYNIYEILKPLDVKAGPVAPWFNQPGLGTQYEMPSNIQQLIEQGYLKRIGG